MIREALEGRSVLLTGATGFLGTALFERLLLDVPLARLHVVLRGDAPARIREMLSGSAFGPAVQRMGMARLRELVEEKANPISADLASGPPPVPDDVDLVIHTAATVSFDPPIAEAFRVNLRGTLGLHAAAGGRPFLHVSTCYVAGLHRGTLREELLERSVDWRAEEEAAGRAQAEVEADSRRPEVLRALAARARAERGRVGPQAVSRRTEELRLEWIRDRLTEYGRARARSLGWPDVYSFTKALTEMALDEAAGDSPLTIVRPSIIESALFLPYPGWIEGFRMAEPILLAFGRGTLPDFPGIPDGVLDIIPVDLVVNAIVAAAARPPERRAVYQVASGLRNPLRIRRMYELTREYYLREPLPERDRGFYRVPEWSFPGRRAVERRLQLAEKAMSAAERVVSHLPRASFARETVRRVDRLRRRLDFLTRYANLYGAYVEAEVVHTDHRVRELFESLPEADRRDFPFDASGFTWRHYLHEVHFPMITAPIRWPGPRRPDPSVRITANGSPERPVLAVLDVERTLIDSNVVEGYMWLRLSELEGGERLREVVDMARRGIGYLKADRRDRADFLRLFYRLYEGASADRVRALAREVMGEMVLRRLSPAGVRRIREHRAAGHRVVLITGSVDFAVDALAPLADELVTASLREEEGVFTGDLARAPLVGEARASWLEDYARDTGADLASSYGYADSISDLALLEAVGRPVAVNPDVSLTRVARARRWPIEEWPSDPGTPFVLVPKVHAR